MDVWKCNSCDNREACVLLMPEDYELTATVCPYSGTDCTWQNVEAGFVVTPKELDDALMDAHERISSGVCRFCGKDTELRYGMCFKCSMQAEDKDNG